jgi:mannose PTS system EIIA component
MVGILVVSHGTLAEGVLDAMTMIIGKQDAVEYLSLGPNDSVESLTTKIIEKARALNDGDGVLALTDLFGASPFNASGMATQSCDFPMDIVTGFNLGMVMESALGRVDRSLDELAALAKASAGESIKRLSEEMDLS